MTRESVIIPEMNLKNIISESREVAQALNEFADELERIEKKYADPDNAVKNENENPLKWFPASESVGGIRVPKSFIVKKRSKHHYEDGPSINY